MGERGDRAPARIREMYNENGGRGIVDDGKSGVVLRGFHAQLEPDAEVLQVHWTRSRASTLAQANEDQGTTSSGENESNL